jgi:two-component system, NtrC family, response regulator AtoC
LKKQRDEGVDMEIVGTSQQTKRNREDAKRLSRSRQSVIIVGEMGVGKGHIAEAIHLESKDARKPCVRLNVATTDPTHLRKLVELAIEKGEFHNPISPDHGNFKLVDGTTLILEDLDRAELAAKKAVCELLSFCRKKKWELRIIVLVQSPISQSVKNGTVLQCVLDETKHWESVKVHPLRDRPGDIPDLVEYFVKQITGELGMADMVIDANAIGVLVRQEWKENVQELKRMVERSIVLSREKDVFRLPAGIVNEQAELSRILDRIDAGTDFALDNSMEIIEKGILLRTLEKFGFNQSKAARFLKITEDTLRYRMRRLGIPTARKQ